MKIVIIIYKMSNIGTSCIEDGNINEIIYKHNNIHNSDPELFSPKQKKYIRIIVGIFLIGSIILSITNVAINHSNVGKHNSFNLNMDIHIALLLYGIWFIPYFIFFMIPMYLLLKENKPPSLNNNYDSKYLGCGIVLIFLHAFMCSYRIFLFVIICLLINSNAIAIITLIWFSVETFINLVFVTSCIYALFRLVRDKIICPNDRILVESYEM